MVFDTDTTIGAEMPSHVMLFGSLLAVRTATARVEDVLSDRGYREVWRMWNGFDRAQDEAERKGGVRVWRYEKRYEASDELGS
jgi:phosphatidylinositol glycan class B